MNRHTPSFHFEADGTGLHLWFDINLYTQNLVWLQSIRLSLDSSRD